MSEQALARPGETAIVEFDPKQTREKLAELDGDIVKWRKLRDWPKLEEAVDAKMVEQTAFVTNWDETVSTNHGGDRSKNALGGSCSVEWAEAEWGISQQMTSRWRIWLKRPDKYRQRFLNGALRTAGLLETTVSEYFEPLIPPGRFSTIVIDPPWDMRKIELNVRPNQTGPFGALAASARRPYGSPAFLHAGRRAVASHQPSVQRTVGGSAPAGPASAGSGSVTSATASMTS
jgi:hypothetical protein